VSNPDPTGRDALLAAQLLRPGEAAIQAIFLSVGISTVQTAASRVFVHDAPGNWISLGACSTRSLSRGSVHIASADAKVYPEIDPAYFAHDLDIEIAAWGLLAMAKLVDVEPLASCLKRDEQGMAIPHPAHRVPTSVEDAKEYLKGMTGTEYHPVGSCAMLPREKGGVVDGELRVYGTRNVRVVDASVFPTHVQGNVVSLVYAVAEKAADVIKAGAK
jgi:choline dehydrogenase-like flavoprotein